MLKEVFVAVVTYVPRFDPCVLATGKEHGSYGGALIELEALMNTYSRPSTKDSMHGSIEKRFKLDA